jgi:hypothetical protein
MPCIIAFGRVFDFYNFGAEENELVCGLRA